MTQRLPSELLACLIAVTVSLLAAPSAHAEVSRKPGSPKAEPTGRIFISPGRVEQDVQPGVEGLFTVELTNDSDQPFDVTLKTTDLGQSVDPRGVANQVEDGEFGAGDWLIPEVEDLRLKPWEQVTFAVKIAPPLTAPIGTNLAGLVVDSSVAGGAVGSKDSDSMFRVEGLIQVFLTVPGPVKHELRIVDVDIRDSLVLEGNRFAVWDVTFENRGTVNEHVAGSVNIRSVFGNSAHRTRLKELIVLRGSKRTHRVIWNDLPWVGMFTPDVQVRGDDAKLVKATGERVVVFPWWLPVALVLAIVLPWAWIWWRRRQEWQLYLEDENWDESGDEDGASRS